MTAHRTGDEIGGRYRIEQFVGEGGMQEVYRATDALLGRTVALKIPKNNSAAKRFARSAIASARVNHANVAKTLDYLEEENSAYLIEEFIVGKDLSAVQQSISVLDPLAAARIFHHLAKGLAASHHAGVLHRDIKPSNVMVVNGELLTDLKITDFGIAKMAQEELEEAIEGGESSLTASGTAIGALPYMAPEMIESVKDADKAADIWSLGAVLYELMSSKKPFGSGLKAVPAILEAKTPPIPAIAISNAQFKPTGEEVYKIVLSCLRKEPSERPTADDLVSKCEQLCYPACAREMGTVRKFDNSAWGFITDSQSNDVFFHVKSVFGPKTLSRGDKVLFARFTGGGSDRGFPILKMKS